MAQDVLKEAVDICNKIVDVTRTLKSSLENATKNLNTEYHLVSNDLKTIRYIKIKIDAMQKRMDAALFLGFKKQLRDQALSNFMYYLRQAGKIDTELKAHEEIMVKKIIPLIDADSRLASLLGKINRIANELLKTIGKDSSKTNRLVINSYEEIDVAAKQIELIVHSRVGESEIVSLVESLKKLSSWLESHVPDPRYFKDGKVTSIMTKKLASELSTRAFQLGSSTDKPFIFKALEKNQKLIEGASKEFNELLKHINTLYHINYFASR